MLFSLRDKDKKTFLIALSLFMVSILIYSFDSMGKPRGFLVDTFAIYGTIFSPLLFIYFFYSVYRSGIRKERGLIWYITTASLIFSFLLSFRQKIDIEDYAPYVVIFVPYMVRIFFNTFRVRLPEFRKRHYIVSSLVLIVLFINSFFIIINKPLYLILENPKKHFIYKYDFAKDLAMFLKEHQIYNIDVKDKTLQLRLRFYGINEGNKYHLEKEITSTYEYLFTLKYFNKPINTIYIVKG